MPIYGAMLALLVYGSSPQLAQVVDAVPPSRTARGRGRGPEAS